jgi:hypothetical protein
MILANLHEAPGFDAFESSNDASKVRATNPDSISAFGVWTGATD